MLREEFGRNGDGEVGDLVMRGIEDGRDYLSGAYAVRAELQADVDAIEIVLIAAGIEEAIAEGAARFPNRS